MAITYPITLPTSPGFVRSRLKLLGHTTLHESSLDKTAQVLERAGARWSASFSLPGMKRSQAALWIAALVSLRGRFGTFYARDPDAATPRGTVSSCTVNGASQTGHTLAVTMTGSLLAGDFIELATGRYHMVVQDQSGSGGLEIEPALRESPANSSAVTFSNPKATMRLTSDAAAWEADRVSIFGLNFEGIEAL